MKKQAPKDLEKRADVALDKRILNVMRAKLNSSSVLSDIAEGWHLPSRGSFT